MPALPLSDETNRNAVPDCTESDAANQNAVPDAFELYHGLVQHWIAYTATKKLQSELDIQGKRFHETEKDQYVVVTGMNPEAFEDIIKYRDIGKLSRRLRFSFEPKSDLLIIEMPGGAHELYTRHWSRIS